MPAIEFQSKAPHTTLWLHLEYPEAAPPTKLLADLAAIGWKNDSPFHGAPPFNGVATLDVNKPGSGLFQGWTPAERRRFMKEVKPVLVAHGVTEINHRKLTLADLL